MKIGVVGLGFMGSTHLQAYQSVAGAELAAVASSDLKKLSGDLSETGGNLDRGAQKIDFGNAARYTKAEELFADPNVEAVDLCVPSYLHAPLAIQALEAGKHVLVEKPMALSGGECDQMIAAAEKCKRVLMVGQVLRYWPDYAKAREIVRSGSLGPVRSAFFRRKCAAPAWSKWMKDRSRSGGGIFDLLIHDFDYCLQLFGKPKEITAVGIEDLPQGIDTVEARLVYEGGPPVVISGGWHHLKEYPFSMEFAIVCHGGTLDYSSSGKRLTLYKADGTSEEPTLPEVDGFQVELTVFLDACKKGAPPADCLPQDSATATRMALAMRASREQGGAAIAP